MTQELDNYYLKQPEPIRSCLLALRDIILGANEHITHQRKYQIPFFYYKKKKLCFLWLDRKKLILGFVKDRTIQKPLFELRRKDKIESMIIDPNADIPVDRILTTIQEYIQRYDAYFTENKI